MMRKMKMITMRMMMKRKKLMMKPILTPIMPVMKQRKKLPLVPTMVVSV